MLTPRCISTILPHTQEVKRYEEQRKGNKSTYWVIFELTWRDYYRYFTMRSGNAIFMEYGITNKKVSIESRCCPQFCFCALLLPHHGQQERRHPFLALCYDSDV